MCRQAGATPVGMFFLISVGNVIEHLKGEYEIPVDALVEIGE